MTNKKRNSSSEKCDSHLKHVNVGNLVQCTYEEGCGEGGGQRNIPLDFLTVHKSFVILYII